MGRWSSHAEEGAQWNGRGCLDHPTHCSADIVEADDVLRRKVGDDQLEELGDVEHLEGLGAGSLTAPMKLHSSSIFFLILFEIPRISQQTMLWYMCLLALYLRTWSGSTSSIMSTLLCDNAILCALYIHNVMRLNVSLYPQRVQHSLNDAPRRFRSLQTLNPADPKDLLQPLPILCQTTTPRENTASHRYAPPIVYTSVLHLLHHRDISIHHSNTTATDAFGSRTSCCRRGRKRWKRS